MLEDLERKVEAAAKTIDRLKRENKTLKNRVKKLEAVSGKGSKAATWAKERDVVQKRLSKLAGRLDDLL